jgi:hypothetical protein
MPNPLPPQIISLSVLTCQAVLREEDGVASAIRLIDVWYVPEPLPEAPPGVLPLVQANVLVILKAEPGYQQEHEIRVKLQNTVGEISDIAEALKSNPISRLGPEVPGGVTIQVQLNLAVKKLGTCYLLIYFDGELVTRAPITLLRTPSVESKG